MHVELMFIFDIYDASCTFSFYLLEYFKWIPLIFHKFDINLNHQNKKEALNSTNTQVQRSLTISTYIQNTSNFSRSATAEAWRSSPIEWVRAQIRRRRPATPPDRFRWESGGRIPCTTTAIFWIWPGTSRWGMLEIWFFF